MLTPKSDASTAAIHELDNRWGGGLLETHIFRTAENTPWHALAPWYDSARRKHVAILSLRSSPAVLV